jgi:hypothetical protein
MLLLAGEVLSISFGESSGPGYEEDTLASDQRQICAANARLWPAPPV